MEPFSSEVGCFALIYVARKKAGAQAELHVYTKVGHAFGVRPNTKGPVAQWPQRFMECLDSRRLLQGTSGAWLARQGKKQRISTLLQYSDSLRIESDVVKVDIERFGRRAPEPHADV